MRDEHPSSTDAPEASLRAELLGQLAAAQLALESAIAELSRNSGDSAALGASRLQLTSVSDLLRTVGSAPIAQLAQLRSEVSATAANAAAVANQATGSGTSNAAAVTAMAAAQRARATIEAVGRALFDNRVLDPYLRFASPEDEEAYRKRERERETAFEREKSKNTADGDRRALQILRTQASDAKAHGADGSPPLAAMEAQIDAVDQALSLSVMHEAADVRENSSQPLQPKGLAVTEELDDIAAALKSAGVAHAETTAATSKPVAKVAAMSPHSRNEQTGRS